jgi:hypothetical protein
MACTWRHADRVSRRPEARAEVLCLGDSLVKQGVLPRILSGRLGRSAYNLAVHGGQAPTSYFLLRRAIEQGARPRLVLVDFHPNLLASSPTSSVPYWSDLLNARELVDLGRATRDARLVARTIAYVLFPSVKNREAIRAAVLAALHGGESDERTLCRALGRNFRENLGARVAAVRPPPANPDALLANLPDLGRWKPSRVNVAYMHRLFDLAARSGAAVVWLWTPTSPAWQARRVRIDADAPYARLALAMQAAHPNLIVVDGRPAEYPPSAFVDLTHLHAEGAAVYTEALAGLVDRLLAGGPDRWLTLPHYAGPPRDRAGEDLDQSRIAVLGGGPVRR